MSWGLCAALATLPCARKLPKATPELLGYGVAGVLALVVQSLAAARFR